jgi:hypothetical protein
MWRVRQAASTALADLLTGRRWRELAPHMEEVGWRVPACCAWARLFSARGPDACRCRGVLDQPAVLALCSTQRAARAAHTHTQMWTMALRAFDDVKESVRSAAAGLLRTLRGLSLRLMDRQQTPAAGARGLRVVWVGVWQPCQETELTCRVAS